MQERFELLPRLKLDTNCDPEPQAIDDAVVTGLVVHAHALAAAMTWGVGGGFPDAYAASQREDKAMSSDARVACQTLGRVNGALCDGLFTERCILTASAQCAASPPASACPADAITFLRSCVPAFLRAVAARH